MGHAKGTRGSTKSLSGSVLDQYFENRRQYCSDTYYMPNDEIEQTRLAVAHQAFLLCLNGQLTTARVPQDVKRILDIGTSPGDWAIAMGERYPNAEIIATDISVFQPTDVPPNVVFQVDDAREEWTYTEPFDFIHIRGLAGAFSDWTNIYAQAFRHLRQGGFLEVVDVGFTQLSGNLRDPYIEVFNGACQSAAEKAGTPCGLEHMKRSVLAAAGFGAIRPVTIEVPLGTWSPDRRKHVLGKMALIAVLESLEAVSLRLLTKEMAWKADDVRELCERVKEEVTRPEAHAFTPFQFLVARRLL